MPFYNGAYKFCSHETDGLPCGRWIPGPEQVCKLHKGKKETRKRTKIGPYSGYSKYREEQGQFQGREGK